jgi:P-type Cu2+ transporter
VAIPLADDLAATRLQRRGVFLRSTTFWSHIRRIRHIVFDKTGTLTLKRSLLINPEALNGINDKTALALARLTNGSLHPVTRALPETLGHRGQQLLRENPPISIHETPGHGVEIDDGEHQWTLGRNDWKNTTQLSNSQDTVLSRYGVPMVRFSFRDALRPSAHASLAHLRKLGFSLYTLYGDQAQKVDAVAKLLDIPPQCAHGGLLPEEKADAVRSLDQRDTLYLGDGANDSLAFDAAYVTGPRPRARSSPCVHFRNVVQYLCYRAVFMQTHEPEIRSRVLDSRR